MSNLQISGKQFLTFPQLAARWGYKLVSLRSALSRGLFPVPIVRLMPNGDPRVDLADVERHEANARAGTASDTPTPVNAGPISDAPKRKRGRPRKNAVAATA